MERETGIEPAPSAWKAEVLPLNYSRPCGVLLVEGGGLLRASCPPPSGPRRKQRVQDLILRLALRAFARRASLRLFKIAPGDLVEPHRWFSSTSMALCL